MHFGVESAEKYQLLTYAKHIALSLLMVLAGCTDTGQENSTAAVMDPMELAESALSQLSGDLPVEGLKQSVEVLRDAGGIAHIYAQNTEDLFFAQGYVTAQDRLWQMEMWRRWQEGRLAEIFGPAAFAYDARARLMQFRGPWDEKEWTSYHPEGEKIFTAFANGVNAFIEQNRDRLPVEFQLTGVYPEQWTAQTVVLRWAQIGLTSTRGNAINEIQLAMQVLELGIEEANRRAAPDPWDDLQIPPGLDLNLFTPELLAAAQSGDGDPFTPGRLPPLEVIAPYASTMPPVAQGPVTVGWDPADAGSNNWVMSGARTPSGIPILANDPHRRIEMPALRYMVHLNAPGWNVIGASDPPFVGVGAGHNENMAWGLTFAGTDMVDLYVEELHPTDGSLVKWQDGWESLRTIQETIAVKGESEPRVVELTFSRHGPVFHIDRNTRRAFAVRSAVQEVGTAAYLGSLKLQQAQGCEDFFERTLAWKVPTHNMICGDKAGNIAMQVAGLAPDRDGWNGRLPVQGDGRYEWQGLRTDLPSEMNPERGYIATANDNTHPAGYEGRPVFYHSANGLDIARITRLHQLLSTGEIFTVQDHMRMQHDAYSLQAERDKPLFEGWTGQSDEAERARRMIAEWDNVLTRTSVPGALFVRWSTVVDRAALNNNTPLAERVPLIEAGLLSTIAQLQADFGSDWTQWRYGRVHLTELPHSFLPEFDLPAVERPGGFNTLNANGANFRRIIDLSNLDNSVWSNSPGQSGQPGSPYYGDMREHLANGRYLPLHFSREAVERAAVHRLNLLAMP